MSFDPADQGLFVRSLSTGGEAGGLAYAVPAAVEVMSAAYDRVIVETTGVGQTETDVEFVVDTVVLVIQPGSGDVLQFIKAGIMEIPDVVVVNKGDHRQLATRAAADLSGALDAARGAGVSHASASWQVPVMITSARDRTGIDALADALAAHLESFDSTELAAHRRAGALHWTTSLLARRYGEYGLSVLGGGAALRHEIALGLERGQSAFALSAELGRRLVRLLACGEPAR
jgi:LAO/AO transport system kinase